MSAKRPHEASSDSKNDAKRTRLEQSNSFDNNTESFPELDKLLIKNWGLDDQIVQHYESKGITKFFPWQVEALELSGVLDNHKNLVFSAPTSAGKTMVSDVLLYKTVLERKKKVIVVLPLIAVAAEKVESLKNILKRIGGLKVVQMAGDISPRISFDHVDVAVCTIEKANNLINRLIEEKKLQNVGLIIVDELHMLGDENRGYILELLLTKLLYQSKKDSIADSVQIVGMSATLLNSQAIATWLNAEHYRTDFRPIPLYERVVYNYNSVDTNQTFQMELLEGENFQSPITISTNDAIVHTAIETITNGHSALVFCPRIQMCKDLSIFIAENLGSNSDQNMKLKELIERLRKLPSGLNQVLAKTLPFGIAFHNTDLKNEERCIIEEGFRDRLIKVLCCTTTLATGINLPARRVLITSPRDGQRNPIKKWLYRQMIGRAGRKGIDNLGEGFLFCEVQDLNLAKSIILSNIETNKLEPIISRLTEENLIKATIEIVSNETANFDEELIEYFKCTFFHTNNQSGLAFKNVFKNVLNYLEQNKLIYFDKTRITSTKLGRAIVASAILPKEGLIVMEALNQTRNRINLDNDLQLIYLVTPTYITEDIKKIYRELMPEEEEIGKSIGILSEELSDLNGTVVKRFFASMAVSDLLRGDTVLDVARRYTLGKVKVEGLQKNVASFAGSVAIFCSKLGWHNIEVLIEELQPRLAFNIPHELIDLMKIPFLPVHFAKILHKKYSTRLGLIYAKTEGIGRAITEGLPFEIDQPVDPKLKTVFVSTLRKFVTISELSERIFEEVHDSLQSEGKLPESESELSVNNILTKLSSISIDESEFLQKYDQDFVATLPECLLVKPTPEIADDEFITVSEDSEEAIRQMISILAQEKASSVNLIVHFVTKSVTEAPKQTIQHPNSQSSSNTFHQNSEGLFIENGNSFELSEILITKPGEKTVFKIHTKAMFEPFIDFFQETFRKKNSKKIRVLTYDIKLAIHIFVRGFKLSIDDLAKPNIEFFDLQVAIWLLDPEAKLLVPADFAKRSIQKLSLKDLLSISQKYRLDSKLVDRIERLFKRTSPSDVEKFKTILLPDLLSNCCQKLIDKNLYKSYRLVEIPARFSFAAPEINGVLFDTQMLEKLKCQLERFMEHLKEEIFKSVGYNLDPNNLTRVKTALDSILIQHSDGTIQKFENTNKTTLKMLQTYLGTKSNLPTLILKWRKANRSLDSIGKIFSLLKDDEKVYPQLSEWTTTGRIKMKKPNLINIQKEYEIEDLENIDNLFKLKKLIDENNSDIETHGSFHSFIQKLISKSDSASKTTTISLRKSVVAREGYCLISADYRQLELRLLAHFSKDELLKQALNNQSIEIFKSIAATCQKMEPEEVKPEGRQMAKQVCYGILYGMGSESLAKTLNITDKEAKDIKESFLKTYPRIREFIDQTVEDCRKNEFVKTLTNRRRLLPNINSSDREKQSEARRRAVNTRIQGSGADCAKMAMLAIDSTIRQQKMNASLVLQMHDELIYEVRDDGTEAEEFAKMFKNQMESVAKYLEVSLPVNIKRGKRWGSLEEIFNL